MKVLKETIAAYFNVMSKLVWYITTYKKNIIKNWLDFYSLASS